MTPARLKSILDAASLTQTNLSLLGRPKGPMGILYEGSQSLVALVVELAEEVKRLQGRGAVASGGEPSPDQKRALHLVALATTDSTSIHERQAAAMALAKHLKDHPTVLGIGAEGEPEDVPPADSGQRPGRKRGFTMQDFMDMANGKFKL